MDGNISLSTINAWISDCDQLHKESCHATVQSHNEDLKDFRLIDVEEMCIIEARVHDHQYLVLSYVWGQVSTYQLLHSNEFELE